MSYTVKLANCFLRYVFILQGIFAKRPHEARRATFLAHVERNKIHIDLHELLFDLQFVSSYILFRRLLSHVGLPHLYLVFVVTRRY